MTTKINMKYGKVVFINDNVKHVNYGNKTENIV